jgi:hypothetical protein
MTTPIPINTGGAPSFPPDPPNDSPPRSPTSGGVRGRNIIPLEQQPSTPGEALEIIVDMNSRIMQQYEDLIDRWKLDCQNLLERNRRLVENLTNVTQIGRENLRELNRLTWQRKILIAVCVVLFLAVIGLAVALIVCI